MRASDRQRARVEALRQAQRTYTEEVHNPAMLRQVERDLAEAEAVLANFLGVERRRRPSPAADVRRLAATSIRNMVRSPRPGNLVNNVVRHVEVSHERTGPLGGVSSHVTWQQRDPAGVWHNVVCNVYADGPYGFVPDPLDDLDFPQGGGY